MFWCRHIKIIQKQLKSIELIILQIKYTLKHKSLNALPKTVLGAWLAAAKKLMAYRGGALMFFFF